MDERTNAATFTFRNRAGLYPGVRHETLNETNREQVQQDIVNWLDRHLS